MAGERQIKNKIDLTFVEISLLLTQLNLERMNSCFVDKNPRELQTWVELLVDLFESRHV